MEIFRGSGFNVSSTVATKRRSNTSRKPRADSQMFLETLDVSTPSTPSSDDANKPSSESGSYDSSNRRKVFNLNTSTVKTSSINKIGGLNAPNRLKKDDRVGEYDRSYGGATSRSGLSGNSDRGRSKADLKRCPEVANVYSSRRITSNAKENSENLPRSPDNYKNGGNDEHNSANLGSASNGSAEKKLRKVKLKVGGVTHTLHAQSNVEGGSSKPLRSSDALRHRQKLILQENSDDDQYLPENGNDSQGMILKGSGGNTSRAPKESLRSKVTEETSYVKQPDNNEPVRKSRRVPKRRVLDGEFDEVDEEIRYLERLRNSKTGADYGIDHEDEASRNKKSLKASKGRKAAYDEDEDFSVSQRSKDGRKKSRSDLESEDMDFAEEEELSSDVGPEAKRRKQEPIDSADDKKSLTTRQRALQSSKDGTGGNGTSLIEFPNGLPPAVPRKQKEKLSEVEQQLKKAEAAQRRRMQVEKAAREIEAEAIKKILGQDSSRKKREEKMRKRREELAQERAANSMTLAPNTVRWVMGPTGTTVTFPEDVGLPSIFNSKPFSYPPPREKCAVPSCTNAYKYRDSKSNLPLCSLQCYRAVQQNSQQLTTC